MRSYKLIAVYSIILNITTFECNAKLYTILHKNKNNDKYHCSTSKFLSYTIDKLCKQKNDNLTSNKYTPLVYLENYKNKPFCSASPHLSSTKEEICSSYYIKELKEGLRKRQNISVIEKLQSAKEKIIRNEIDLTSNDFANPCKEQKGNLIKLKVILTKYDHYNDILMDYAKYIESISPFNVCKAFAYINYINRNIYPNSLKLTFDNYDEKNELALYGTLSLDLKNLSTDLGLNTGKKAFVIEEGEPKHSGLNYFAMGYNDMLLKNSRLNYEIKSYSKQFKHNIKYSKLLNIKATQFIKSSVSYNNFDYMSDVYTLDNFNNSPIDILDLGNNYLSNNLILDFNYTGLYSPDIDYTIGCGHRWTKYKHKLDSYRNYRYNVSNAYGIIRFENLGIYLYLEKELTFNKKYKDTIAAILYKGALKDYYFNALSMYGNRNINSEHRELYYNNEFVVGKKINISSKILEQMKPYIGLRYMNIKGHNKKNNNIQITSIENSKLQKIIGIDVIPVRMRDNDIVIKFIYWHNDNKKNGCSLEIGLKL
ncbi:hypothetical protein [Candidatus Bandiella euplotis]|uniref:Outer membrane protein n=2 Tax=Candidatus Bandiella euplotis TaxID=1664265 RepID=A0ABZ0UJC5_9RICK|nr:hypothetical protein [Candidatus Bandiella woodruffii]WPX96201.1 hypothetical protein Bandiella_00310 [Candidatus Bandiella woodruffii]